MILEKRHFTLKK